MKNVVIGKCMKERENRKNRENIYLKRRKLNGRNNEKVKKK
jgi:hypothetical protein